MATSETPASTATRELAAIMFSDVVGYTAIMGRDEQAGLDARKAHRELLQTILPGCNGRLLGDLGDGALSSFHSAIDAVNCARAFQAAARGGPKFKIRIGIHLGDVLFSEGTVLGDGVNIASRIQALAPPGGICVSEHIFDAIRNKPGVYARDLGRKHLKNVTRPIRVYALATDVVAAELPARGAIGWRVAATGAIAVLVVAAAVYAITRRASVSSGRSEQTVAVRAIRSIAVLPLDNYSGDPNQEYFADGMTDELTTDLAKISTLRVISRGSVMRYKGAERPPTPEIAKALNVDAVVEGSVMKSGDKVRITAQLVDAPSDKHLWAESYERDTRDVLALQDEVALAIARQINVELTPHQQARLANARPVNPQAYAAYLKGRYFLQSFDADRSEKAIAQFEQAITADPNFAPAYTGLADAYSFFAGVLTPANEVMPKAKAAAEKALQLDNTLAEAHTSLAFIKFAYDFDWAWSEREFRQAIALNPNYAMAHDLYGFMLGCQARFDESQAEFRRALALDPLSAAIATDAASMLVVQGKVEAAREQLRKGLELNPNDYSIQLTFAFADLQEGKNKEAIVSLEKLVANVPSAPAFIGYLGSAYAAAGERAKAQAALEKLNQIVSRQYVDPICPAAIYISLGDKRRGLDQLDKAYELRSQNLDLLKVNKLYDPLRSEPRFIALLKKIGLDK